MLSSGMRACNPGSVLALQVGLPLEVGKYDNERHCTKT